MSILDPATLGNLLDGLGIAPDLLKPIPGLVGSVMDVVHGVTVTVGGITAGLGLPLPSLSLPGLGKILAVTPTTFTDASSGYSDNQSTELYSGSALANAISTNPAALSPSHPSKRSPSEGALPNSNLVDTAFSSASSTCNVEPYQPEAVTATLPAPNVTLSTLYRYRRQHSVNLGSLFVLESWMVPSLFACATQPAVSELDVANGWGGSARALLERHWDTWITEKDFQWMSSIGINTVRLPIGYWHLPTEHASGTIYESVGHIYEGAWPRVIRTVSMAADHGIGVLIDLHGQPHSGVSDGQATLFSVPSNMDKTIDILTFLTKTFVTVPNVVGIQLLNEPNNVPELLSFYNRALDTLRGVTPEAGRFPFYVHDGFDMRRGTDYVENRRDWVVLDHHAYYVFTPSDMSMAASAHITNVNGPIADELKSSGKRLNDNLFIGEWSCALTGESLKAESDPQSAQSTFCRSQMDVYTRAGGGWSFWSYKKENCEHDLSWCFANAVGKTLPHTFFSYQSLQSLVTPSQEGFHHAQSSKRSNLILSRLFPRAHGVLPSLTEKQMREKYAKLSRSIALAQERVSQDVQMPPLPEILGKADYPGADLPIGAVHPNTLAPSIYRSPPVPMTQMEVYASNKANVMPPMVDEDSKPVTPQAHRFTAIQRRREARMCLQIPSPRCIQQAPSRLESREAQPNPTAEERIMQRGYSDGFLTAKMFAQHGPAMSRLGFKTQYAKDTVGMLKDMGVIADGDESKYEEWFWKGLYDGEGLVEKVIAAMTSPS